MSVGQSQKSCFRKIPTKYELLSSTYEALDQVVDAYIVSFESGMSIVEIARVSRIKNASFIHGSLRKKGIIGRTTAGAANKKIIPAGFSAFLDARGL